MDHNVTTPNHYHACRRAHQHRRKLSIVIGPAITHRSHVMWPSRCQRKPVFSSVQRCLVSIQQLTSEETIFNRKRETRSPPVHPAAGDGHVRRTGNSHLQGKSVPLVVVLIAVLLLLQFYSNSTHHITASFPTKRNTGTALVCSRERERIHQKCIECSSGEHLQKPPQSGRTPSSMINFQFPKLNPLKLPRNFSHSHVAKVNQKPIKRARHQVGSLN